MAFDPAKVHVQQATRVSCVAACVCMVLRRRGELIEEREILEKWGSGGPFALRLHARGLQDSAYPDCIDPDAPSSLGLLRNLLRDGRWIIVSIVPFPHPNAHAQHAVVLIYLNEDDQFLYLDPAEPLQVQPRVVSEDELIEQWTGELIVCPPFD